MRYDDANVGLGHAQMLGEVMPHHVGKLVAHPDGKREGIFPITGDAAPPFQAQRLLAADAELALDHEMSVAECLVHFAALVLPLDEIVIRARVMDKGRVVLLARRGSVTTGNGLVIDLDEVHRVFGSGPILGDDGADRLAAEPHLVDGEPVLHRLAAGKAVGHAAEWIDLSKKLLARQHLDDAGQLSRLGGIDGIKPGVGVLAAQERHVVHARQLDVVEKAAIALDQRDRLVGDDRRPNHPLD